VLARPATLSYRVSKFVTRNKVQVVAAVFVVVALLVGIAVAFSQAKSAREQARVAREQRDAAQQARERAEKTSRFMQSFLNYANPHWSGLGSRQAGRTDFTVREALHDVVARMDTELADSPEVRADLHYTIAEVLSGSGDGESAAQHFRRSLELYRQVHGNEHPKVARAIYYASLYEPDRKIAEEQLRQAVLLMRRTDPENVNLPHMLQALGQTIAKAERESRDGSRLAEAETLILEAQTIFTRSYGENHVTTVSTYGSLAHVALARGDLPRAESLREEVLRHYQQTDQGSYEHIWALFYVGEVKRKLGKEAEAETFFRQALELARKRWDANDRRFQQLVSYLNRARAEASGR
jgi:serine/threonine-protein kinase